MAKISRLDLYLNQNTGKQYTNTAYENELVSKFVQLYTMAKQARDSNEFASPKNLEKWRKAYYGTLNALNRQTGEESKRKSTSLRKLIFEMVESKIDNQIPQPKMVPRYKADLPVVEITENYLKFEMGRAYNKVLNDRSERATYVDGTTWYKIWWDSLDNTHKRSGNVKIEVCLQDQIVPQPGVTDYHKMEYIFEEEQVSVARIYDLFGRLVTASHIDTSKQADNKTTVDGSTVTIITCYYLNENRIVGRFIWVKDTEQVIANEEEWQIRKIRRCKQCSAIVRLSNSCPICGSTNINYETATEEILEEDLIQVYNPYEVSETDDESKKNELKTKVFLTAGTKVPYYIVRQLPFVPRPAVSSITSIYGVSEPYILLDMQDSINKMLSKAQDKTLKSGTIVTKPQTLRIGDMDDSIKVVGTRSAEEAAQVQAKQIMADTSQDIVMSNLLYDSAKASSGVSDSFQGKRDTTAVSGKAKQIAALQSSGRIESLRVMKSAAFAGVYELMLKYLLAFSDESRKFVKILPDGTQQQQAWNKYMFLDVDNNGEIYYRDDFVFDSDPAATLSQDRVAMWQETQDKFVSGAFGPVNDPRVLTLFWNIMAQQQYPLATLVLAGIKENAQHLPPEVEQALMQNPEILQATMQALQANASSGQGGARPNSGPAGNGATHATNVERTNQRNRALNREASVAASKKGSIEGVMNESTGQ